MHTVCGDLRCEDDAHVRLVECLCRRTCVRMCVGKKERQIQRAGTSSIYWNTPAGMPWEEDCAANDTARGLSVGDKHHQTISMPLNTLSKQLGIRIEISQKSDEKLCYYGAEVLIVTGESCSRRQRHCFKKFHQSALNSGRNQSRRCLGAQVRCRLMHSGN